MRPIVDQTGNVILWHLWQLLLEDTFETSENDETLSGVVIVDHTELDVSVTFFDDGRLDTMISKTDQNVRGGGAA
jgi:hypothetical protein